MEISEAVDFDALLRWMDTRDVGRGEICDVERLTGGTQNIMLGFRRGDDRFVLRRPPLHLRANSNETMRREITVLTALAGCDVPHPLLIAASPEEDVLGASFYLMEAIDGFNVTTGMPRLHAGDPALRRAMGFSMVDGLLKLGRVSVSDGPLAGLGRAEGFLERQVGRWRRQLESYDTEVGWPGASKISGVDDIAGWLEERCPPTYTPGLMHGDFHLANVMFRNDGAELAAIVDWELATVGDPLLDLAWLLTTWPRPDDPTSMKIEPWEGFPDSDELFEAYAEKTERDVEAMQWYLVLACYKLGILLEGTYARACAGKADIVTGERFHARTVALFERALEQIS